MSTYVKAFIQQMSNYEQKLQMVKLPIPIESSKLRENASF